MPAIYSNRHHIKLYRTNHWFFRREIGINLMLTRKLRVIIQSRRHVGRAKAVCLLKMYIFGILRILPRYSGLRRQYA